MKLAKVALMVLFAGCSDVPPVGSPDAGADPLATEMLGHWHDTHDPTKLLQFNADGTYFDSEFDDWTSSGYHCTGAYSLQGAVLTLEETCPKATSPIGDALPCRYVKDVLAAAVAGTSLSVTSFHRADGLADLAGDWRHHTERWRQVLNPDGACVPIQMEESDDLDLALSSGGAFTYSITTKAWNPDTQQFDTHQSSHAGTYHASGTQVILDAAPIAPMQLLGTGLAPGEKLYAHD